MDFVYNFINIFMEAAPWLLLGFIAAGLIKVSLPEGKLNKWLGGKGLWSVTKAALIGAPLPLCSCGVLPAATELHRSGASRSSTVSFLISTPETGVDSISLSYVMLGPVMAIIRPIAAIGSAIVTGLLAGLVPERKFLSTDSSCSETSCGCSGSNTVEEIKIEKPVSCCNSSSCADEQKPKNGFINKVQSGLKYALVDMIDDLLVWLSIGLVLAALIATIFPPMAMAEWGSGLPAMMLMLLIGIPMYICATASTPIAASLILAGVSPGTVLVFLLAGPATNIATIGVLNKEMGKGIVIAYLVGVSVTSVIFGYLADWYLISNGIDVKGQMTEASEWVPHWVVIFSSAVLVLATTNVLLKKVRFTYFSTIKQKS